MKKGVKGLILSIMFAISIILVSIPIWQVANGNKIGILANYRGEHEISIKIGKFAPLIVISEDQAFSIIEPTTITLSNKNGYDKSTELYLLIDKSSTVSYEYLRVSINDKIYNLKETETYEDENNYYFKLNDYNIESYGKINLDTRIWLSTDVTGLKSDSSLVTNFILERGK